mmetsp:Transcript_5595/g.8348  ORF Transcript_5595/g.8348 Transcript_5595/m.8348 type:complete len:92 (+) Transcript_5595:173-448(+)
MRISVYSNNSKCTAERDGNENLINFIWLFWLLSTNRYKTINGEEWNVLFFNQEPISTTDTQVSVADILGITAYPLIENVFVESTRNLEVLD